MQGCDSRWKGLFLCLGHLLMLMEGILSVWRRIGYEGAILNLLILR
jgi:hypothetical protein